MMDLVSEYSVKSKCIFNFWLVKKKKYQEEVLGLQQRLHLKENE